MDLNDHTPESPSRSQEKREAEALQKLGERLIKLPKKQLELLPLPENLRHAIEQAQRITSHGALKRQRQYVGRLMRDIDPQPVRSKLDELTSTDKLSNARFHQNEHWRDRLIAEGDAALAEFLAQHPQADRQHLRRLMREAASDAVAERTPQHARELFRYIQSLG
ncbi:MAG TPA: ribosome biogenesis factor YjgA [Gammaproteobacteria bacterium]|nr:ribosome biogenesis factor YjgA [Gammaproteobacteria bacterium]